MTMAGDGWSKISHFCIRLDRLGIKNKKLNIFIEKKPHFKASADEP